MDQMAAPRGICPHRVWPRARASLQARRVRHGSARHKPSAAPNPCVQRSLRRAPSTRSSIDSPRWVRHWHEASAHADPTRTIGGAGNDVRVARRIVYGARQSVVRSVNVVLISTYELGRQPFGLASPAAWLRQVGATVTCLDLAVQPLEERAVASADLVALYVPMHTATRLGAELERQLGSASQRNLVLLSGAER